MAPTGQISRRPAVQSLNDAALGLPSTYEVRAWLRWLRSVLSKPDAEARMTRRLLGRDSLRALNDFSEMVAGLPYSLWALPACSGSLGWLVHLVGLWGTQVFMYLALKISRSTIRVYVVPPT